MHYNYKRYILLNKEDCMHIILNFKLKRFHTGYLNFHIKNMYRKIFNFFFQFFLILKNYLVATKNFLKYYTQNIFFNIKKKC